MTLDPLTGIEPNMPEPHDVDLARKASEKIASLLFQDQDEDIHLVIKKGDKEAIVHLPNVAVRLLLRVLTQIAEGNAVTLVPIHAELTTQEAANFLNVSRPFLVSLLEKEKIPFHKVGRHRRIQFHDLLDYKHYLEKRSRKVREELTKQAQDLDLGY